MPRILSEHGNVIAADFRRRTLDISVEIKADILYQDDHVVLSRAVCTIGGKPFMTHHYLFDLTTGRHIAL